MDMDILIHTETIIIIIEIEIEFTEEELPIAQRIVEETQLLAIEIHQVEEVLLLTDLQTLQGEEPLLHLLLEIQIPLDVALIHQEEVPIRQEVHEVVLTQGEAHQQEEVLVLLAQEETTALV